MTVPLCGVYRSIGQAIEDGEDSVTVTNDEGYWRSFKVNAYELVKWYRQRGYTIEASEHRGWLMVTDASLETAATAARAIARGRRAIHLKEGRKPPKWVNQVIRSHLMEHTVSAAGVL